MSTRVIALLVAAMAAAAVAAGPPALHAANTTANPPNTASNTAATPRVCRVDADCGLDETCVCGRLATTTVPQQVAKALPKAAATRVSPPPITALLVAAVSAVFSCGPARAGHVNVTACHCRPINATNATKATTAVPTRGAGRGAAVTAAAPEWGSSGAAGGHFEQPFSQVSACMPVEDFGGSGTGRGCPVAGCNWAPNMNVGFASFADAWAACGAGPSTWLHETNLGPCFDSTCDYEGHAIFIKTGCSHIMKFTPEDKGRKVTYFMRRQSDPVMSTGEIAVTYTGFPWWRRGAVSNDWVITGNTVWTNVRGMYQGMPYMNTCAKYTCQENTAISSQSIPSHLWFQSIPDVGRIVVSHKLECEKACSANAACWSFVYREINPHQLCKMWSKASKDQRIVKATSSWSVLDIKTMHCVKNAKHCTFTKDADGVGGAQIQLDNAATKEACEAQVLGARPTANGATWNPSNTACYAEFGMTGTKSNPEFVTCKLVGRIAVGTATTTAKAAAKTKPRP